MAPPVDGAPVAPSQQTIDQLFPLKTKEPATGVFEIGLVMAGTVSAGAYTAGVLDMLIEALDTWYLAKQRGDATVPPHDVQIKIITGASGGGVCAGILAKALRYDFPHVNAGLPAADAEKNPLHKVWTGLLNSDGMLSTEDLTGGIKSLLNGAPIDQGKDFIVGYTGDPLPFASGVRPYVANPLPIVLTLANLRGVPYETDFGGGKAIVFTRYADYFRFSCNVAAQAIGTVIRPDEFPVGFANDAAADHSSWDVLGDVARGTGAFPLGFPPRPLAQFLDAYNHRIVLVPKENEPEKVRAQVLTPAWDRMLDKNATRLGATYPFLCVDGGTFNNEPLQLARTHLAGEASHNPRDARVAHRAVVLIDPLIAAEQGPAFFTGIFGAAGGVLSGLIGQNRFGTADLALLADPNCYSRFLITPEQDGRERGEKSITGGAFEAFVGFIDLRYRVLDFLLGRANCWEFLRNEFVLHESNSLFASWGALKTDPRFHIDGESLPIIPLVGSLENRPSRPAWPTTRPDLNALQAKIETRFKGLFTAVPDVEDLFTSPPAVGAPPASTSKAGGPVLTSLLHLYLAPLKKKGPGFAAKLVRGKIEKALAEWKL